jgi:hypothetical protein
VHSKDQSLAFAISEDVEQEDLETIETESAAVGQRHVLEDNVNERKVDVSQLKLFPSQRNANANSLNSERDFASAPDVANGLSSVSTRNAETLERNATGEELHLVIVPNAIANGSKDQENANKDVAVAQNVFAMENNVSRETQNATGLERNNVLERKPRNAIGEQLERLEDKNGVAIRTRSVDSEDQSLPVVPRDVVFMLMLERDLQRRDVADTLRDVLIRNAQTRKLNVDSLVQLQFVDVSIANKEFVSNQRLLQKDPSASLESIHIGQHLMERNSIKLNSEDT